MQELYDISGLSRQGYHKACKRLGLDIDMAQRLKEMVVAVRKEYPRISIRKIHKMLKLEGTVGINGFERMMSRQGMTLSSTRSKIKTTHRGSFAYANLVNGLKLSDINQLWVSDITYY